MRKTLIGAAAVAVMALGTGATAYAATPQAATGPLGAYAYSQVDGNHLAINVKQLVAKAGQPVIGFPDSTTNPGGDLSELVPPGSWPAGTKEMVYTPDGAYTGLCVADPDNGSNALVLRDCNGLKWQAWTYNGAGWTNQADGLVITEQGPSKQLVDQAAAATPGATQTWTATQN